MMRNYSLRFYQILIFLIIYPMLSWAQYGSDDENKAQSNTGFEWPEGKKVALSLTFDDARLSQIDNGIPIFDKYGVKATFYVSPAAVPERLDGWKQAIESGHEIGNHSMTHPCTGNFPWAREKALETMTLRDISTRDERGQ